MYLFFLLSELFETVQICIYVYNLWICGEACIPHLQKLSCHISLVVKSFDSGQCGLGAIPGQCRYCSQHLQSF